MILRVLEITVPVFAVILVAYAYGRWRPVDMGPANRLNLALFVPALIFYALSEQTAGGAVLVNAALASTVIVLGSGALAWLLCRWLGQDLRSLVPAAMFNNCGNMGLPLVTLTFGQQALPIGIVFLIVTTLLQFTLGLLIVSGRLDWRVLITNPLLLATLAGLLALGLDWHAPAMLLPAIKMLGDVAIPLMLTALGIRLAEGGLSQWRDGLLGGLLTPLTGLIVAAPLIWLFDPEPPLAAAILLYAALPPAVMNYVLAEQYGHRPQTSASIVAAGHVLAVLIMPAVLFVVL
ncbi:MAG: Auxin Efflux carrier [Salinisphaeraceae bacterium]|nr:Auxin Efflux carrier [Salinisphaeraceae bacterium]